MVTGSASILYDVEINVTRNGVFQDKINSYFAMRKIALEVKIKMVLQNYF